VIRAIAAAVLAGLALAAPASAMDPPPTVIDFSQPLPPGMFVSDTSCVPFVAQAGGRGGGPYLSVTGGCSPALHVHLPTPQ
jgi:hypothetical protein